MEANDIDFGTGLGEQVRLAGELACEKYMEAAGLSHKGYSEDQVAGMFLRDLEAAVDRTAVLDGLKSFQEHLPPDAEMTAEGRREVLVRTMRLIESGPA